MLVVKVARVRFGVTVKHKDTNPQRTTHPASCQMVGGGSSDHRIGGGRHAWYGWGRGLAPRPRGWRRQEERGTRGAGSPVVSPPRGRRIGGRWG